MKSHSSVQKVKEKLKCMKSDKSDKKSRKRKKEKHHHHGHHRSHHNRYRNPSASSSDCSDWSEAQVREISDLRQAVKQLKSLPFLRDLSEPIHSLTDYLSDSPKELLAGAWSAVGLEELLNLTPSNVIETCRRRALDLGLPNKSRLPGNWPLFSSSTLYTNESLEELWSCCLEELERMPPDEVGSIMEGEMDPLSVTWKPMQNEEDDLVTPSRQHQVTQTVEQAEMVTKRHAADSTTHHPSTTKPAKSCADVQNEMFELEMRMRAIRAMLSKNKSCTTSTPTPVLL